MPVIITTSEILEIGLVLAGFDMSRQKRVSKKTNECRFRSFYGSNPVVYAQIWEDLQNMSRPEDRIYPNNVNDSELFLMCVRFLKAYPVESELAGTFHVCEKTARKMVWYYLQKLQALKKQKIRWPDEWNRDSANLTADIFLASVDGVHFRISEPRHPTLSKDPNFYSHKFNQAGVCYEIGVSLYENRIVWANGPFPAAKSDVRIFREDGLKEAVPDGKRLVADNGYKGEKAIISTPNAHDEPMLRKFKRRGRSRHETINARFKNFRVLDVRFRHQLYKHEAVFEAICVICQYQLEYGSPLFDI